MHGDIAEKSEHLQQMKLQWYFSFGQFRARLNEEMSASIDVVREKKKRLHLELLIIRTIEQIHYFDCLRVSSSQWANQLWTFIAVRSTRIDTIKSQTNSKQMPNINGNKFSRRRKIVQMEMESERRTKLCGLGDVFGVSS